MCKVWDYHHDENSGLLRCDATSLAKFIVTAFHGALSAKTLISIIIKPTRCANFSNLVLEWNSTCFGKFLCPSSRVFHCTHSNGICHTGLLTACKQDQDGTSSWSCSLQMMDRGTVRNMQSFITKINLRN